MTTTIASDTAARALLNYLYAVLTDGREQFDARNAAERFITWCLPGLPIDADELRFLRRGLHGEGATAEERDADARILTGQAARFAMMCDFIPDVTGAYGTQSEVAFHRSERSLARMYQRVLTHSQVAALTITPEEQAQIERWQARLYGTRERVDEDTGEKTVEPFDGPELVAYKKYQASYEAALMAYNAARLADPGFRFNEPIHRNRLMLALDEWKGAGKKGEVETALARLAQATGRDLALWKRDLEARMVTGRQADEVLGEFWTTALVPAGFASKEAGWVKHTFHHELATKHQTGTHTRFGGDLGLKVGKFKLTGGGASSRDTTREISTLTDLSVSFEVAQVPLVRPWFDPVFLESRTWRLGASAVELTQLSDGKLPPQGQLIGYPTAVIFARSVTVDAKEIHDELRTLKTHVEGGGGVSFGPFHLGGKGERTHESNRSSHEAATSGWTSSGLQILGFRCHLLDASPNPLPTIEAWA